MAEAKEDVIPDSTKEGHSLPKAILLTFGEWIGDCDSLTLVDFFSKTLPSSTKKLCSKEGRVLANGPSFETIEKKSGKYMSLALAKGNTNRPLKIAF